jgi:hypothetical protein
LLSSCGGIERVALRFPYSRRSEFVRLLSDLSGRLDGNEMFILDLFLAAISLAPLGLLFLF